jgi:hypothetical protein
MLISIYLQIVVISALCAEYTMGMEIFFAPPDGPPRWRAIGLEIISAHLVELLGDMGQVEACFSLFEDSVNLDAR